MSIQGLIVCPLIQEYSSLNRVSLSLTMSQSITNEQKNLSSNMKIVFVLGKQFFIHRPGYDDYLPAQLNYPSNLI